MYPNLRLPQTFLPISYFNLFLNKYKNLVTGPYILIYREILTCLCDYYTWTFVLVSLPGVIRFFFTILKVPSDPFFHDSRNLFILRISSIRCVPTFLSRRKIRSLKMGAKHKSPKKSTRYPLGYPTW